MVNSVLAGGKAVSDGDASLRDHVFDAGKGQSVKLLNHRSKFNCFNCDAISGSGNGKMYTDTDSGGRTEIITHINVKSHAGSHNPQQMEVKVDPGAESNCMPLRHFRTMFPHWCDSTGRPKHGVLGKSEAELEAYNGGAIIILGWVALHLQHIEKPEEWIPARFYVIDRGEEDCRTLISHSTSNWTGLIEVKCQNKAPIHKRQVYSVNRSDSSNQDTVVEDVSLQPQTSNSVPEGTSERKKSVRATRRKHHKKTLHSRPREMTGQQSNPPSQTPSDKQKKAQSSESENSVLKGPVQSRQAKTVRKKLKLGPKRKSEPRTLTRTVQIDGKTITRTYYQPPEDMDIYEHAGKGILKCVTNAERTIKVPTDEDLPGSREAPIWHNPLTTKITSVEQLRDLYPNSFDRLGSLEGEYEIKMDPSVPPVRLARRKVPIESKEPIEKAIQRLVEMDIIVKVIEPTDWISASTWPRKPDGTARCCLDPKPLNKGIIRECHKPMTVEEIAHQMTGAKKFTKTDATKAFWQCHLTRRSSFLTTFHTHIGRFRFLRMPFGAKMSQDVFQMKMDLILEECPGVIGIHDDFVIYAIDDEDHDANLINYLNVCQKRGLVLNGKKLELKRDKVSFFGAEYSAKGMHPCPKKIQGLTEMTPPGDKQQLNSYLGMITWMSNHIPNLSHHTEPLRAMTKQDAEFVWDDNANKSFQTLKALLVKAHNNPLRYFDRTKPVTVQADASMRGLGAALVQGEKPVAFASRSLTDAESRYANIERELLAIVFACKRFDTYILGREAVTVETDHKPLEMIQLKDLNVAPKRLTRMLLELQRYNITIKYRPGKEMQLADAMSRCPARTQFSPVKLDLRVDHVAFKKTWIEQCKQATEVDPILSTVYQVVLRGWPSSRRHVPRIAKRYWDFRDELSIDDGLLLKGPCIVIPSELREQYLERLHHGHLSASKVQKNAKRTVYWTGIDADILDYTRRCQTCIKQSRPHREPLQQHTVPERPWQDIAMDHFEFKSVKYLLVCDRFSKFPYCFRTGDTKFTSLRDHLINLFAVEGAPERVQTDNGPPFFGEEFKALMTSYGIEYYTSSPNYAPSNGFIERQVQSVKRCMVKALELKKPLLFALADLRATAIDDGLPSPAEILHGRNMTTGRPVSIDMANVRERLIQRQLRQKAHFDKHHGVKEQRHLVTGEEVYFSGSNNEMFYATVVGTSDTDRSYDVRDVNGRVWRRNRSHLRPKSYDIPSFPRNMVLTGPSLDVVPGTARVESQIVGEDPVMHAANNQALRELQGSRSKSSISGPCSLISERPKQFSKTVKRMQSTSNSVPSGPNISQKHNTAVRSVVDTSPKVPLKSALKQTKMTRFSDRPTVHPIPARSKRARRCKHTDGGMYDPDYEAIITIEPSSEEPSPAQDQVIVQEDAETETLSEVGAIDTDDTQGEPVSDELVAPQVDIVPPFPTLADVNGPIEPSSPPPAEVTSSPPRTPMATVDVSSPLTEESHPATPLTEASHPGSALTDDHHPPTEVSPPERTPRTSPSTSATPSTSASTSTSYITNMEHGRWPHTQRCDQEAIKISREDCIQGYQGNYYTIKARARGIAKRKI